MHLSFCDEQKCSSYLLEVTEVDHLLGEEETITGGPVYGVVSILFILVVNCSLIYQICSTKNKTNIDKFILMDCIICIGNIVTIFNANILGELKPFGTCHLVTTFAYTWNLLNACLSLAIILYRAILILKSSWLETKRLQHICSGSMATFVIGLTSFLTYQQWKNLDRTIRFLGKLL